LSTSDEGWLTSKDDDADVGPVWVVSWDRCSTFDMVDSSDLEYLGYNEPDPMKRVPKP
jgi:hypothetical protein